MEVSHLLTLQVFLAIMIHHAGCMRHAAQFPPPCASVAIYLVALICELSSLLHVDKHDAKVRRTAYDGPCLVPSVTSTGGGLHTFFEVLLNITLKIWSSLQHGHARLAKSLEGCGPTYIDVQNTMVEKFEVFNNKVYEWAAYDGNSSERSSNRKP